jgi:hypothetical protein
MKNPGTRVSARCRSRFSGVFLEPRRFLFRLARKRKALDGWRVG